jgi:lysophospholipase L1-like esterase
MDRIVTPYRPKTIVIYAGSHDLRKEGGGPEEVLRMFKAFRSAVLAKLPDTRICYISMKPSLAKWETIDLDKAANRLIEEFCARSTNTEFIDIWTPMLEGASKPSADYFKPDRNHPSEKCYQLWAGIIRDYIE